MKTIVFYEPAMCCETGVCGPSVDSELLRILAVVNGLKKEKNVKVERFNLTKNPSAFANNSKVAELLQLEGADVLPITFIDDVILKKNTYPTNEELSELLNIDLEIEEDMKEEKRCDGSQGCC